MPVTQHMNKASITSDSDINMHHHNIMDLRDRLGHAFVRKLKHIVGLYVDLKLDLCCQICCLAKQFRLPFPLSTSMIKNTFDLITH